MMFIIYIFLILLYIYSFLYFIILINVILASYFLFCVILFFFFFFFFFQAEDGIRDVAVTGVQTCALPICSGSRRRGGSPAFLRGQTPGPLRRGAQAARWGRFEWRPAPAPRPARSRPWRSEERRVGKECRAGGAREH